MRHFFLFHAAAVAALLVPFAASAHETQQFQIGDEAYSFVVGSINEPVAVDDKSGVELQVNHVHDEPSDAVDETQPHTHEGDEDTAVLGLEQTLKVEVAAGGKKQVFDLRPASGEAGTYRAVFYPTVQTTYTYRFFGTIDDVPFDASFICNPAGHPATSEDSSDVPVSEGVTRTLKKGTFGCPAAKAAMGFPEPSATIQDLRGGGMDMGIIGVALGALGVIMGGLALRKRR